MALWLIRAGSQGEHEHKFLEDSRAYLTWSDLEEDLTKAPDRDAMAAALKRAYPDASPPQLRNYGNQVWAFAKSIAVGDWFALPSKFASTIHFAEVTSTCKFDPNAASVFRHYIGCKWLARDVPRSRFDQDLLYSLGAFLTVCRITRNDAEVRIRAIAANGWQSTKTGMPPTKLVVATAKHVESAVDEPSTDDDGDVDLEQLARDGIARMIDARFKGHGLARLVEAILRAQGYATHRSPEGADHGVDILAGGGPMGFGAPSICVQVKSGDGPVDRPSIDQLVGTMQHVGADHGLFVAWGGFKSTVHREIAAKYFRLRLWDQKDLIEHVLAHYADLDAEIRAELPLKRIWTVAGADEALG